MAAIMDTTTIELAQKQATLCKVVGSSRRLIILWLLSKEELSVNEIAQQVGSSVQNVSQHLSLLKKFGIVTTRRAGQTIYYQIGDHECLRKCPALLGVPDKLE
jgi:ArsR family transcriptional regulator, virulence genes transcriptional regulator